MASPITISQFRVSFIWFETILSLLGDSAPDKKNVPFYFLGRNNTYEAMFSQIQQKPEGVLKLTLPWKNVTPPRHFFWYYYLNGHDTNQVSGRLAWESFVPFRGLAPYAVEADWIVPPGRLIQEAFYYPHGVAYVLTACCEGSFTLDEFAALALKIRKNAQLKNTTTGQNQSLDDLAILSLTGLRAAGWGDKEAQGVLTNEPFTICTVVKGDGASKTEAPNQDIQNALMRVSLWSDDYNPLTPTPLKFNDLPPDDALILTLPIRRQAGLPPCDILYAAKTSRTVWFPGTFLPSGDSASLAAYHRNLTLVSLQMIGLCGLILASKDLLNGPIGPVHSECLRRALSYVEQLYGGQDSYHSYSARIQLDWNKDLKDKINDVRAFWNLDQLARAT